MKWARRLRENEGMILTGQCRVNRGPEWMNIYTYLRNSQSRHFGKSQRGHENMKLELNGTFMPMKSLSIFSSYFHGPAHIPEHSCIFLMKTNG